MVLSLEEPIPIMNNCGEFLVQIQRLCTRIMYYANVLVDNISRAYNTSIIGKLTIISERKLCCRIGLRERHSSRGNRFETRSLSYVNSTAQYRLRLVFAGSVFFLSNERKLQQVQASLSGLSTSLIIHPRRAMVHHVRDPEQARRKRSMCSRISYGKPFKLRPLHGNSNEHK